MKVILTDNVENLGKRGDIVDVAVGFGRNYLIPRKLALKVTPSNMKTIEMRQKALRKKLEKEMSTFQAQIDRLNEVTLTFTRKVSDQDHLFGSVSVADIKEKLDRAGFEIERRKILLAEPIKKLGRYTIPVKIFHDDKAEITVEVLAEKSSPEEPAAKTSPKPAESTVAAPGAILPDAEEEASISPEGTTAGESAPAAEENEKPDEVESPAAAESVETREADKPAEPEKEASESTDEAVEEDVPAKDGGEESEKTE